MRATDPSATRPGSVDLTPGQLDLVRELLARHGVTDANRPVIFGSRARGHARRYSDLDLGFAGVPLPRARLSAVREALEESRLPMRVDVLNLQEAGPELREHVLEAAVALEDAIGSGQA